jgi:hypothetical protein
MKVPASGLNEWSFNKDTDGLGEKVYYSLQAGQGNDVTM